jgi:hypothetical protein
MPGDIAVLACWMTAGRMGRRRSRLGGQAPICRPSPKLWMAEGSRQRPKHRFPVGGVSRLIIAPEREGVAAAELL